MSAAGRAPREPIPGRVGEPPVLPLHETPLQVLLTEAIPRGHPRLDTEAFRAAAQKEVKGLHERGTFEKVKFRDLPAGANVLRGRMVYTLKNKGTPDEAPKALYMVQGNNDQVKLLVVHNLETPRQLSTCLLVSTAAVLRLRLFAHDITQAYLQSQGGYSRKIYLRPSAANTHLFGLQEDEVLLLLRPLYGICDAGDYWHATFTSHIEDDLGMTSLTSDRALYYKRDGDGHLSGSLGAYVDDSLMAGDRDLQQTTELTLRRFDAKERQLDGADFVGVTVSTIDEPPRL